MLPAELQDTLTPLVTSGSQAQVPARLAPGVPRLTEQFWQAAARTGQNATSAPAVGLETVDLLAVADAGDAAPAVVTDSDKEREKMVSRRGPVQLSLDDANARRNLENIRWPDGPVCPRCGGKNIIRLNGAAAARGQLHCRPCRRKFTVTVGTPLHGSRLPMGTWTKAIDLIASAPRRYPSAHLHRDLDAGITYETARRMRHLIPRKKEPEDENTP